MTNPLEATLLEHPPTVPRHPFYQELLEFGAAEGAALVANTSSTAALEVLLPHCGVSPENMKVALSLAGPVLEKVGFFAKPSYRAWRAHQTTTPEEREPISTYVRRVFSGTGEDLIPDLLVHDPLYVTMMMLGQEHSSISPTILSVGSFIAAIAVVALGKVGVNELRQKHLEQKLQQSGFQKEVYFESRFYLPTATSPHDLYHELANHFELPVRSTDEYHDQYVHNALPAFSGRVPRVRLRKHHFQDGQSTHSGQVIFTRTKREKGGKDQADCFPARKEKWYYQFPIDDFPESVNEFPPCLATDWLKQNAKEDKPRRQVSFSRHLARDPHGLLLTVDDVVADDPLYLVELKVHKENSARLLQAMRYLMAHYDTLQITYSKVDLKRMSGRR